MLETISVTDLNFSYQNKAHDHHNIRKGILTAKYV